jgi:hypothetical protein
VGIGSLFGGLHSLPNNRHLHNCNLRDHEAGRSVAGTPATRGPPVSSALPRPAPARVAFLDRMYSQTALVAAVLVVGEQAVSGFLAAR